MDRILVYGVCEKVFKDMFGGNPISGIEIGAHGGSWTSFMLYHCENIEKLHCVDPWRHFEDDLFERGHSQEVHDKNFEDFQNKVRMYPGRIETYKMGSEEAIGQLKEKASLCGGFDFVFIDGCHDEKFIKRDIELYYPLVRPGGFFGGHDYGLASEVTEAVDRCFPNVNKGEDFTWWVIKEEIRIYTLGDSHSWHAWLRIPWAKKYTEEFVPMTMYVLGKEKPLIIKNLPADVPVCFSFGEVDCRFRIHDHQPWQGTIDKLVKEYFLAVDKNAEINPDIWIFNVLPPPKRDHLDNPAGNTGFPFRGSDNERLAYVTRMNQRLREGRYPFIDVYDEYCDEDGFLDRKKSDSHVHIKDEKPLMDCLDKKLKEWEASNG